MERTKKLEVAGALVMALLAGRLAVAAELNQAGPAQAVVGGTAYQAVLFNANSVGALPIAVMVYSSDAAEFWIRRAITGVPETIPIPVPEGQSLIIPVSGWRAHKGSGASDDTFRVRVDIGAVSVAVADSVLVIPFYR